MLLCENHIADVVQVCYTADSSEKFATCSEDTTIRLWDANNYSVFARCSALASGYPTCCNFTDEVVISGWSDGRIRSFRIDTCEPLWTIDNAHNNGVSALCLSYNQKFICSGGNEGEVRVWEIRSRELISHLKEHTSKVTSVQVFKDDVHLLTCARDRAVLCWDLKNEKRISNHTQSMGGINCFAISPEDEQKVVTVGQERSVTFWDLRKSNAEQILESSPVPGESDELFCVSVSCDGQLFATGGSLGTVRVWDYNTGECLNESKGHSNTITSIAFSPDNKQLISTGRDGLVLVWNLFK